MKKILSIILSLLTLSAALLSLVSCGEEDNIPDGNNHIMKKEKSVILVVWPQLVGLEALLDGVVKEGLIEVTVG